MALNTNSLLAYQAIQNLGSKQREVYEYIQEHQPCYLEQISEGVNSPMHCVSGRINDLKRMGMVQTEGKCENARGREVDLLSVTVPGDWMINKIMKNNPTVDQDGVRI